ncbi:LLM class flavin-dependent oxidoreductase [Streptomyces sp. NBC_01643]|uniref:LLM class flavin-dependent oxidoreductase n=1 Tax=Streptomyces sp. NBC_01643 TaxID=2975906 RepID=UPI003868F7AD|nr:LLM class flavin-dependent oxidoreductase [Streptomyces sp. NBC_01643]
MARLARCEGLGRTGYDRTGEYLSILRRAWASSEAFSHEGRHYRFEDYGSEVLPFRAAGIPIYFGGSSEAAYRVGGKHADISPRTDTSSMFSVRTPRTPPTPYVTRRPWQRAPSRWRRWS